MYLGHHIRTEQHEDDRTLVAAAPTTRTTAPTVRRIRPVSGTVGESLTHLAVSAASRIKPRVVTVEKRVEVPVETVVERIVEKRVEIPVPVPQAKTTDSAFFDDASIDAFLDAETLVEPSSSNRTDA